MSDRARRESPQTRAAAPTRNPIATRIAGGISPRWIEYWRKRAAPRKNAMPPSQANRRTLMMFSQSKPGEGDGGGGPSNVRAGSSRARTNGGTGGGGGRDGGAASGI